MLIDYKFLIPLPYYFIIVYFVIIIINSFYSEVIKKKNLIIKYEKDLLRISFNYFNIIMHNLRRCIIFITLIISIYLTLKNRSYFIFTFISSLFFLRDFYPLIKCKKK